MSPAVETRTQTMLDKCVDKAHQDLLIQSTAHIEVREDQSLYIITLRGSWHHFAPGSYIDSFTLDGDSENGLRVSKLKIGIPVPPQPIIGGGMGPSHTATQEIDI